MADKKYTRASFAASIKEKYPAYAEMDDNELVDKIIAKYPTYADQIGDDEVGNVEASVDGASTLEDTSSESPEPTQEEHNARAEAGRNIIGALTHAPDWLIEPAAAFVGTIGDFGSGIVAAVEQFGQQRINQLRESDPESLYANATPEQKDRIERFNSTDPEERLAAFEELSSWSNSVEDTLEGTHNLVGQYGSGSISTDFADGNYASAAKTTINQSASGLASLVPFFVPGGQVLGPAILGGSTVGSSFKEDIRDIEKTGNATLDQIALASYIKGGSEFATEFVTAGILGRAKKLAGGGASREAVNKFTQAAWKRVFGDAGSEFLAEGLTDTANRLTDHYIYGTPWDGKEALVGFLDAGFIGAIVGGKVSTFGQLANPGAAQDIAANALKTTEQKEADASDLQAVEDANQVIAQKEALGTEGSLVDTVVKEEAEVARDEAIDRVKDRQKKHVETLNDMTEQELKEYADNKDKADKLEAEKKRLEELEQEVPDSVEDKINEHRLAQATAYNTVANWRETTEAINQTIDNNKEKVKEIEQEESNIALEEKQAAKAEQPNPVGTQKRKQRSQKLKKQKVDIQKNIDSLNKVKDEARPGTADAKTRKRQAKKKPTVLPESATQPIKDAAQRTDANEDLAAVIADKSIPTSQKEKVYKQIFKVNAPLIGQIAGQIASKNGVSKKEVSDLLKTEIARRIQETGKIDKNTWNTASKAIDRLVKKEKETVKRNTTKSAELKAELKDIQDQVNEGLLDPEAAEILKDDIRREYGQEGGGTTSLTTEGSEGETQVKHDVEKATRPDKQQDEAVLISKILDGTSVKELFDNLNNNIDKIYALLPESATNRRAFSGIFADGNPAVEIWDSYFDNSDETGRKRLTRLKKAVNDRIAETAMDSDELTNDRMMEGAFDFLESDFKPTRITIKQAAGIVGKLKRAFPGIRVVISRAKMAERLLESNQVDAMQSALDGHIKGFVVDGVVYLNEKNLDFETPIHEFGHLWAQATKSLRPDLYKKGIELLRESSIYTEIFDRAKNPKSVYHGLTKAQLEEEVMATAIGRYGDNLFKKVETQTAWEKYTKDMFTWIRNQLGLKDPFAGMTTGEFLNIAVTEMMTGRRLITKEDQGVFKKSLATQFLEVPSGSTRTYTPSSRPITELETHGVFKGASVKKELYTALNRYWNDIQQGGWIGYTTGTYGDAVVGTPKFNAKLNAKVESKVKTAMELVQGEGLQFKRDPKNPGFHVISKAGPITSFLETPKQKTAEGLKKNIESAIKKALKPYKSPSPFKYSRIDEDTRNTLKATLADLQSRDGLPLETLKKLAPTVTEAIKTGKANRKAQKEAFAKRTAETRESASKFVKESSDVDPENLSKTEANLLAKKRDKWVNKLFNKSLISNTLSPSTNNDFYGLLYNLLPEGKLRETARAALDNLIIKPLEKANIDYLNTKAKMRNNWVNAKVFALTQKTSDQLSKKELAKALNDMNKLLTADSSIEFAGRKLSNSDAVKVYNYLKDPSTYRAVENSLDSESLDAIVDYVNSNEQLKRFSDAIPGVYAGVAGQINSKLASHGRQTFGKAKIDKESLTPEQKERLEKIYGGQLPNFAVYTPLTSEGAETDADVDKLIAGDKYAMYTVMDGRLKQRTGGGEIVLHSNNLDGDFDSYMNGPVRTMAFLDFAKNASDFFGPKQMTAMRAAYGDQWAGAVKDSLRRIVTGKNQPSKQTSATRALDKWINRTVGTVMTLNTRSAILQLISTGNFLVNDPTSFFGGLNATRAERNEVKEFLKNSEWAKERGKGKVDLAVDAIFDDNKPGFIDTVLQKGYVLTKLGDKFAITAGGAPYMTGKYKQFLKEGFPKEEAIQKAYAEFVAQAEETQQSTRPERLGQSQTTQMGKLILAFANTPMQYNRKMARAIKDLRASGTSKERKAQARRELLYYGAAQNVVFTSLQKLMLPGVSGDVEDEAGDWANALANTILRGIGVWGAVTAAVKDALIAASKGKDVYDPLIGLAPAVGTKVRHIRTALGTKKIYAQSDLIDDPEVYQIASGINAVTNLPADRAIKVVEQVGDAFSSDLEWYQKALRALGWSRYDLDAPAGNSPLNRNSPFNRCNHGSPLKALNSGEAGQAHSDGTIEVDPNLSPLEKQKTIAHEKKHVADMDAGILGYDDNSITYMGEKYPRKDGKIKYDGKWLDEGDKEFPWEAAAYEAEGGTPLKSVGKWKITKKTPLKQNGPGDKTIEEHDEAADEFTGEWFNDRNTRSRLKEQTGLSDEEIDERLEEATGTHVEQNAFLEYGDAEYNSPGKGFLDDGNYGVIPEGQPGHSPGNIQVGVDLNQESNQGVLEHEQAHALGFDDKLGLEAQSILGKAKHDRYLNQPGETYGNIQEFRKIVGIKPWERNLTPERIMELIEFQGVGEQSDVKQLLKNYDIEKLSEALNTVAEADNSEEGRENKLLKFYSQKQDTALARLKKLYT